MNICLLKRIKNRNNNKNVLSRSKRFYIPTKPAVEKQLASTDRRTDISFMYFGKIKLIHVFYSN